MIQKNEQGIKLSGWFLGTVVRHETHGKCKIFIQGVYPQSFQDKPDFLPDAIQISGIFGGSTNGQGIFSYPNIGATVLCSFLNEDQNFPIYLGTIQGGDLALEQYTDVRSDTQDESVKNGDDARIHKIRTDKATIKIWESGHIEIKTFYDRKYATGKEIPDVGCQIDISENGVVNIKSSTQLCIETPDVMINTNKFTVNCQTMKINSGEQVELYTTKSKIELKDQIDIISKKENHINTSFTDTTSGSVRIDGGFVQLTGTNHPPIYL